MVFYPSRIPYPGVKKSPDPRSATPLITNLESHGAARNTYKVSSIIHGLPTDYIKKCYIHDSNEKDESKCLQTETDCALCLLSPAVLKKLSWLLAKQNVKLGQFRALDYLVPLSLFPNSWQ